MNYQEFINTYNGKTIDYDGVSGAQCVDMAQMYIEKCFTNKHQIIYANAKDYFEKYESYPVLVENFERIKNTDDFIPQQGDMVVWGAGLGNTYGHIAIATGEGNTSNFNSYDLNWGSKIVKKVSHNYKGFLGVLRAKNQSKITGITPKVDIQYKVHIQDIGWTDWEKTGELAGTEGEGKRIEAIILQGNNGLDLSYRVHIQDIGWSDWVQNGQIAGTTGESKRIEAIEIKSNKMLEVQEHIQDIGWMPSSKGTNIRIGTEGKSLRIEAFKINLL